MHLVTNAEKVSTVVVFQYLIIVVTACVRSMLLHLYFSLLSDHIVIAHCWMFKHRQRAPIGAQNPAIRCKEKSRHSKRCYSTEAQNGVSLSDMEPLLLGSVPNTLSRCMLCSWTTILVTFLLSPTKCRHLSLQLLHFFSVRVTPSLYFSTCVTNMMITQEYTKTS
jgi:hypothetical protein